ncbi:MAG: lipopolysaccharide heptosyltransferase II [bacterium]|nr:lipopolysaccharide heptosyltransferase II [bacterium]
MRNPGPIADLDPPAEGNVILDGNHGASAESPARPTGPLAQRSFHRILLIKPSSLGDLVHALPVLHGLRRRYPQARIDWLAGTAFAPLVDGHPDLNEVIRFDRRRFGRMARSPRIAWEFAAFLRALHRRNYDLVVDLQGLFRSGLMAAATGAAVRIGFADARELAWIFYSHRIPNAEALTHAVDRNYRVADLLGFRDLPVTFELGLPPSARTRASEILNGADGPGDRPFAAVLPGARWDTKRWPEPGFAQLIDGLADRFGLPTVLLAGPDEAAICERIQSQSTRAPINLAGRTALPVLAAVLERAAVVICHDSAPMHLAVALGRPLVCILGPTHRNKTGPYSRTAKVLQEDLPCVPCYLRRLSQCRHDHACMTGISVDQVLQTVGEALDRPDV